MVSLKSAFPKLIQFSQSSVRTYAAGGDSKQVKVAILGAAGGIGQPLSLFLKLNPNISELSLYDVVNAPGVTCDISHINSPTKVQGYQGEDQLQDALKDVQLCIIPAGIPRKPGMSRDDLFNTNASIVAGLATAIGKYAPEAWINIISNPVNSTIPVAANALKEVGVYNKNKLFGVSTLDVVRAKTFLAEAKNIKISEVDVPVVGGHAGRTILPIFSQASPKVNMSESEIATLTKRVQNGGTEVVEAKAGKGSATLSMAYAAALFGDACLRAILGHGKIYECAYVESNIFADIPFFASPVNLGRDGIKKINKGDQKIDFKNISDYEQELLTQLKPELIASIEKGLDFKAK